MINIFNLCGWNRRKDTLTHVSRDSDLKSLETFASELHTSVECMNTMVKKCKYTIDTLITGKENDYEMVVKIRYYGSRTKHEHKKNSHRQEIDI